MRGQRKPGIIFRSLAERCLGHRSAVALAEWQKFSKMTVDTEIRIVATCLHLINGIPYDEADEIVSKTRQNLVMPSTEKPPQKLSAGANKLRKSSRREGVKKLSNYRRLLA